MNTDASPGLVTSTLQGLACLWRLRLRTWKNHFFRPTWNKVMRWGLLLTLAGLFLIGDFLFFKRMIAHLDGLPLNVGDELIVQLMNVIFLTLLVMILFSSLIIALNLYYQARDLEFLHALPMRDEPVTLVRFVQCVAQSSLMVLLFGVPIFVAYGVYFQVAPGYYGYLALAMLPFVTLPCLVGVMTIMGLMRFFPTNKTHQIFSLIGLFFLVGMVCYLRFLSPEKFFHDRVSDEMIMSFVDSLAVPEFSFLPSSWISRGLVQWKAGNTADAWRQLAWLWGALVGLAFLAQWISRKIYFKSWSLYQEVQGAPVLRKNEGGERDWIYRLPLSSGGRALLLKDVRIFFRDVGQWSQLFVLFALVVVYLFNIWNLPLSNVVLKNVVSVLNIGLVGFVLSALISRFVFSSVSIEGKKMWTIYTAPVSIRRFLLGKVLMYFPPLIVIAEFLVIASNQVLQVDDYVMRMSVIGVFVITLSLVSMGVGLGAMYPMFDHENIAEISTGTGGILFMVTSMIYVGLVLMLGAWPMYVHFNERFLLKPVDGMNLAVCYGAILALSFWVTFEPMRRGIRHLREMDL